MKHLNLNTISKMLKHWCSSTSAVALFLAALTLVLLSKVLFFRHTTFFVNPDNVDQFYVWYQKLAVSWHHGYLPIWNANVYSGQSFAGELQPGIFYPLNWLWVMLFGSVHGISRLALDYLVAFHFWLAAFGTYLLVKAMGGRKWTAILSGAVFAFSGVLAFRSISQTAIFFGMTLIPYSLYFLVRYHSQSKKRWLVLCGIALGLPILAGHVAPFYFGLLAIGVLELAYIQKQYTKLSGLILLTLHSAKRMLIVGLFAILVAAPQIWVSTTYINDTYRVQANGFSAPGEKLTYADFSKAFNLNIHEFVNLIDPVTYQVRDSNNIFIGLAPLTIILLGWYLASRRLRATDLWQQHSFFVTSLLVLSSLAMIGYATWFAVALYELPFVYQIRELGRYGILFDLGLAVMLAPALQAIVGLKLTKQQRRNLFITGAFLLINAAYLFALRHRIFGIDLAMQTGLVALTLLTFVTWSNSKVRIAALSCLMLATTLANTHWFLPKIQPETRTTAAYYLPTELTKILETTNGQYRVRVDGNSLPPNLGDTYPIQTTSGYSATVYAPYFRFYNLSNLDPNFTNDILGVKLKVVSQKLPDQAPIYSDPRHNIYVYQRASALPKMFVTRKNGSLNRVDYSGLSVTTSHYDDRKQIFSVQVPKASTVILSEIYYPGWQATLDGKSIPIKNYALGQYPLLKSVNLPAGEHTVQLTYKPFGIF